MNEYEVNVAERTDGIGKPVWMHYCRVMIPSGLSEKAAKQRAKQVSSLFGVFGVNFKVTMTIWNRVGRDVEF